MRTRLLNTAAAFGLFVLIIYILHISKALVLPLIIALVIWYVIIQLCNWVQRWHIKKFRLGYGLSLILSIILVFVILYLFFWLLSYSVSSIINEAPKFQAKLQSLLDYFNQLSHNRLDVGELLKKINMSKMFSTVALMVSDIIGSTVLILIYLLFLLLEHKTFQNKIKGMCRSEEQYSHANKILEHIHKDINRYLGIKTFLNAVAGVLSYFALLGFGIQNAEFWGVLIFLLHYIPFIGPIVAVIFVLLAVSIQITSIAIFCTLGAILVVIQFLVGNIFEPKIMGNRLNLSPMVILISLAFWGYIWGIIGMFLCVPVMVIINIIFANFEHTRAISVALSASGKPLKSSLDS